MKEKKPKITKESKQMVKDKRVNYEDIKDLSKKEQDNIVAANTRKAKIDGFKEYVPYLIIIAFIIIIRTFIITPVNVNGTSMVETLHHGDIVLNYKLRYRLQGAKRFDVVIIKNDSGDLVKRIIGLPGDKIRYVINKNDDGKLESKLYINDEVVEEKFISDEAKEGTCAFDSDICQKTVEVPEGKYYVMGDNRANSKDSRIIGFIDASEIKGIAEIRIFPFSGFGNFNKNR